MAEPGGVGLQLEAMIELLHEERDQYRELLRFGEEKGRVLVENDLPALERIVAEEEFLLRRLQAAEARRLDLQAAWARILGCPPEELTLSRLARHFPPEEVARLEAVREEMAGLIARIAETNRTNGELLRQALAFVNYSLRLFAGPERGVYAAPGQGQGVVNGARWVDRTG